ncbi:TPA: hypothetical protein ENS27_12635 [bacterium]|nr:hypothetical protein [bacterium]
MRFKLMNLIIIAIIISLFITNTEAKIIERILVIVNDEIITQTEFDDRLDRTREMFRQVYKYTDAKLAQEVEKAKPQLLDTMIDEMLFVQDAVKRSIQITDAQVLKEIDTLKKQFKSDQEFNQALEAEGYTLDSLKREKKRELLLRELINQQFVSDLTVTDDEVRKFYQENKDQFPGRHDVIKLKHLFLKFNFTQENKDKAKQKAEMVLDQIKNGADFTEMVAKYSDDPATKANKGDMGYIMPLKGEFPEIEDVASKLNVGQVSDLIETINGYNIIKVTDKRNDGGIRIQIIFVSILSDQSEEKRVEDKINSILQELNNGADFVEMVKKYSDDSKSKAKDGDWLEVPIESMGTDLNAAFYSFDIGSISKAVRTPQGFHIFKIVDRKDLSSDEMEQIRMYLSERKLQTKLSDYSKKLRETSYIQIF